VRLVKHAVDVKVLRMPDKFVCGLSAIRQRHTKDGERSENQCDLLERNPKHSENVGTKFL